MNLIKTFFNLKVFLESLPQLLWGLVVTLEIGIVSIVAGLIGGLFLAVARLYSPAFIKLLIRIYIDIFRSIPLLVLHATGSAVLMGLLTGAGGLASVVSGVFAGVLVDRLDRRHLMIACDLARMVLDLVGGEATGGLGHALVGQIPLASALSLLVWFAYAPQCMSTLAIIKRETDSWRNVAISFGYMFVMAYAASFIVYQVARMLT